MNNKQLIKKFKGKKVAFKNLTKPYQLSIIFYMACDGESWDDFITEYCDRNDFKHEVVKYLPNYVEKYGNCKFGVMEIPIEVAKEEVFRDECLRNDFKTFEDYHKWYCGNWVEKHNDKDRWPCILSDDEESFIDDGWHRFHRYCQLNCKTIPIVYYLDNVEYLKKD
jgi:hypothetical protein